ncbi:glycoside hydrolase family 28 protein [Flammeovirga aprica]|uniref:Glycoside hydrolase family 28 protein n=1 Tax=Flammeovirga aprica JL-4 TaxID=694437 RepID=A0A7X9P1X3_9BACT|nr:glycosyl hydrolase family 28 protein [Flammeovirga aprica]NME67790.1 glycoside hydrolase family 28 protein [Flammeovirga aprica JL-4]
MKNNVFFLITYLFSLSLFAQEKVLKVTDFGAKGDSTTLNTVYFQQAIDACEKEGGGIVKVDRGVFRIGTIFLKDNVKLWVSEGAKIIGSENPFDYKSIAPFVDATGQPRGKCLIGAEKAKGIAIYGKGVIDGQGENFLYEPMNATLKELGVPKEKRKQLIADRPFLVRLVGCEDIKIHQITLRQSSAWTLHFFQCKNAEVDAINIYSHAHRNNDGIDIDSSTDITIKNAKIDAGDDAVCIKATSPLPTQNVDVQDCILKSDWGAIKFGTESMGDFKNIHIRDCVIKETLGGGIKILSVDGANIENVIIENIKMYGVDMPIFVRLGERLRTYRNAPQEEVGSMKNILLKNIYAEVLPQEKTRVKVPSGILITGTDQHKIEDFHLEKIEIKIKSESEQLEVNTEVPTLERKYPEYIPFGVLPAYGMYARNIKNITLKNLHFYQEGQDKRFPILFSNVEHNTSKNLKVNNDKVTIHYANSDTEKDL